MVHAAADSLTVGDGAPSFPSHMLVDTDLLHTADNASKTFTHHTRFSSHTLTDNAASTANSQLTSDNRNRSDAAAHDAAGDSEPSPDLFDLAEFIEE